MSQNTVALKDELLNERQSTHGDYNEVARISQAIRSVLRSGANWSRMNDCQREALEMMCSKIGRVMSGDFNFHDHWDDIAGYAKLGSAFSVSEPAHTKTAKVRGVVNLDLGDLDDNAFGT